MVKSGLISSGRIKWIDIAKGIGMLCVMLHHLVLDYPVRLYSMFYAPYFLTIFFVTAGYTFHSNKPYSVFLRRKVKTLLVPWLFLAMIGIWSQKIITFHANTDIKGQMIALLMQDGTEGYRLWFVAAMFIACCLFYPISRLSAGIRWGMCVCLAICNIIWTTKYPDTYLPWHLSIMGIVCFWMCVGYQIKEFMDSNHGCKPMRISRIIALSGIVYIILLSIASIYMGTYYISLLEYTGHPLLYFSLNCTGVIFIISISLLHFPNLLEKFLVFVGRNSLLYFAFHGKIQSVCVIIAYKTGMVRLLQEYSYVSLPAVVLVESLVMIVPCIVINKYFPLLVGKTKSKANTTSVCVP